MSTPAPPDLATGQQVPTDVASELSSHGDLTAGTVGWPAMGPRRRPAGDRLVLVRLSEGVLERRCLDDHVTATPGDVFLLSYPSLPYRLQTSCGAAADVIVLNGRRPRVASLTPGSAEGAQQCRDVIDYVVHGVFANPVASADSLTLCDASRLVERCLDAAFGTERRTGADRTLAVALDYVEDHLGDDITVADIAGACNLSVRGLQAMFRNRLGVTPMARLRQGRLRRVRAELVASDGAATTVAAVAGRWRLSHPGRFAAAYRELYGESPKDTLLRAGPEPAGPAGPTGIRQNGMHQGGPGGV